jgi:hypothetical protein
LPLAWVAARDDNTGFFEASVYARSVFFGAVTTFAVLGLAGPTIILFGVVDLAGGIWTHLSLKADAQSDQPLQPSRR